MGHIGIQRWKIYYQDPLTEKRAEFQETVYEMQLPCMQLRDIKVDEITETDVDSN